MEMREDAETVGRGWVIPAGLLCTFYAAIAMPALQGGEMPGLAIAASIVLALFLAALTLKDLASLRLPDALTLPLLGLGLAWAGRDGVDGAIAAGLAAAAGFLALYIPGVIYQRVRGRPGVGLGDAKLLAAALAWTGIGAVTAILLYACAGALLAVLLMCFSGRQIDAASPIPFGPFLAFGTWIVWLYGAPVLI